MIHHGQRLPLGFEARDDLLVSMPSLMTLSATRRRTGSCLLGHINHAATAFADLLQQFVAANPVAGFFSRRMARQIKPDCPRLRTGGFGWLTGGNAKLQETRNAMIAGSFRRKLGTTAGTFVRF